MRKFHEAKTSGAKTVTVWGTGTPRREFLHVDDLADACLHIISLDEPVYEKTGFGECHARWSNVGCGKDQTIAEMAQIIRNVTGFKGDIVYDRSKTRRHAAKTSGRVPAHPPGAGSRLIPP